MRLYDLLVVISKWELVTIRVAYEPIPIYEQEVCVRALRTLTAYYDCIVTNVFIYIDHYGCSVIKITIKEED